MPRAVAARISSVDALRGLIMIIMALDHVRDFHHHAAMLFSPEDLTRTTPAIFLTRWVTHICAPVFMFTAGMAAFFRLNRGSTVQELSVFLLKRGLWLVLLDLTAERFAMIFSLTNGPVILIVLWALGWSMVALGLLVWLPWRVVAGISVGMIALHNVFDPVRAAAFGRFAWAWDVLHQQGLFRVGTVAVLSAYPLIPWIGVMGAGFCFGRVMLLDPERRRSVLLRMGIALSLLFIVLRAINVYGDPSRWSVQSRGSVMTILSFLRTTKYPPSLEFLLMTLGPALLLLWWFDEKSFAPKNPLLVFGRTPLFFFLGHLLVAHLLAVLIGVVRYGPANFLWRPLPSMGGAIPPWPADVGISLAGVYAVWIVVVVLMYPLCLWFGRFKQRSGAAWLSYL